MNTPRKILSLAPNRPPKKPTVVHKVQTLGEHKEAFINANNKKGFLEDKEPENPHSWSAILREMMLLPKISTDEIKETVRKLVAVSEKAYSHQDIYVIISRLFGYCGWGDALRANTGNFIQNHNVGASDINLELFGLKDSKFNNNQCKIDAMGSMSRATRHPVRRHVFMYELKIRFDNVKWHEEFEQALNNLDAAIVHLEPVTDFDRQTRYYVRADPDNTAKYRLYCREFTGEFKDTVDSWYVELTIDDKISWKLLLSVGKQVFKTTWDKDLEKSLQIPRSNKQTTQ